ncbi:MAG TPA: DUF72 domain-containing protein [Rhodothermales bacterium]|nr:DUF72 domain-containing protein [Rhodothermales bacterium]
MTDFTIAAQRDQVAQYQFHEVHPHLRFGTASDRYAGWLGQIYPEERWAGEVTTRKKRLGKETFEERLLPIESVQDYFAHFGVLEIDFTFYRPLRTAEGEPEGNLFTLQKYADLAPEGAAFLLKVPQQFFARKLRRSSGGKVRYENNPDFLNADAYRIRFHEPAVEVLGERIAGFLFEQEYQRVAESPSPEENIAELDGFFSAIPNDVLPHLELRSEHLLVPPYFDWLADRGLGHVFSHWTWLPPIRKQWRLCGERFTAGNGEAVARLLNPLNMKYAEAFALAYPFTGPVTALAETQQARDMVLDVTALTYKAEEQGYLLNVIANNRAWGNSPALAQAISYRVLEEEEKHSGL